jgi:hypothetical protein
MPYAFCAMATLLAPALFAASIYMTLGHLVRTIKAQSLLTMPERWIMGLFVGGDISPFTIQGGGCGLMVMKNVKYVEIGEKVVVAGLAIQIVKFGLFGVTSLLLHLRRRQQSYKIIRNKNWEPGLYMLYAVSALIMIRSIFQNEWPTLVRWFLHVLDNDSLCHMTSKQIRFTGSTRCWRSAHIPIWRVIVQ